jgi:hypothetical protein
MTGSKRNREESRRYGERKALVEAEDTEGIVGCKKKARRLGRARVFPERGVYEHWNYVGSKRF